MRKRKLRRWPIRSPFIAEIDLVFARACRDWRDTERHDHG
jgi:hypothetical protein